MALGPQVRTQKLKEQLRKYEEIIDSIIEQSETSGNIRISVEYPDKWVFEELKKKYLDAGWKRFEISSDQFDGTSINLYE